MTASPTPFFAESAAETDHSGGANKMVAPDHSPDAGNMVSTCAKNAPVQPSSAAVPSEEIVRDIIQGVVDVATSEPTEWSACVDDATAAVLALFAPILAEKEAWAERGWNAYRIAHDQAMENGAAARSAERRALAAEAALAAERGQGFREGVDKVCDTKRWTTEMSHAWHRAVPDAPKAFAGLAAAIRSQEQP